MGSLQAVDAENSGRDGGGSSLSSHRVQHKRDVDVQLLRGRGAKAFDHTCS